MKKIFYGVSTLFLLSCGDGESNSQKITVEGYAQGTTYHITYLSKEEINYQRSIDSLLIEIDNSLSTYQPRSIISRINQHDTTVITDKMFRDVFALSDSVFNASSGAFDPTVAPIVNAWGFGFKNSFNTDSVSIDSLMQFVGFGKIKFANADKLILDKWVMLDFNAIAQGYSVDVLADFLRSRHITNFLVEVGGELIASGKNDNNKLWRVGIDKPVENLPERELEAIIRLENKALATSGNYRKFYEKNGIKYAHTINPKTGYPVQHSLLSVTVVTDNCALADAYATTFMVLGMKKSKEFLKEHPDVDVLFIYSNQDGVIETFSTGGLAKFIALNSE